jgi:membrane protein DedA with SNARE-associated domain
MGYPIWVVTSILFGMVAAWVAKNEGKNQVMWFFIGAALNVFVILAVAGIQKKQKNQGRV